LVPRVFPFDACGKPGAAPCPDAALENGIGRTLAQSEVCADAGYLCARGGMVGDRRVMRWSLSRGVLHVRAPLPGGLPDSVARATRAAAAAGILEWDGHPFRIEIDSARFPARRWDVELFWTSTLSHGIGVAHTEYRETAEGPRFRVRAISVLTPGPGDPSPDYLGIRNTAAHEMGHALGVGHSDRPEDIMFPQAAAAREVSARDLLTVDALYRLPAGAVLR